MPFTVTLPTFEGPLDLLLSLIEQREMDITTLSLAAVTDEFLQRVRAMEAAEPDTLADFLVVAAKLVLIKSARLLPRPAALGAEDEEESGEALARALEAYRRYKQVAAGLGEREAKGLRAYPRTAPPPPLERRLDLAGVTTADLFRALRTVLREKEPEPESVDEVVRPLRVTVRERIGELRRELRRGTPLRFSELMGERVGRQEVIATFLALLEVLKLGWARAEQAELWGEIVLRPILEALPDEESDGPAAIDEYV